LKDLYKRFEALDQFQGRNLETARTEDNKAGNEAYVEDAILPLRKMSPGLLKHKEKLPRDSMSVKYLYPAW
jgi:hypothetical protein